MDITKIAIKKAQQSICRYMVSAIGFNNKGDIIATASNKNRIAKKGMSIHAEIELIRKHGRKIRTIIICRTNKSGDLLPIHPCHSCQRMAEAFNIKIRTIL
jgi:cytidine deaminase